MVTKGLIAKFEIKPGFEAEAEEFLAGHCARVEETEPGTITWYGVRLGPTTYGVIDAFVDEDARNAHLQDPAAASFPDIFAGPPEIEMYDILVAKLP